MTGTISAIPRSGNRTITRVVEETSAPDKKAFEQIDLFTDYAVKQEQESQESADLEREKRLQRTMLDIKKRYGKNAILKGMNLEEGATAKAAAEKADWIETEDFSDT